MTDSALKEETGVSADEKKPVKKKKANAWVEYIESLTVAVMLALILRTFVVEAFVIPTGSMAGSLYGDHLNVTCPNCGYGYAAGYYAPSPPVAQRIRCPNCGSRGQTVPSSAWGGDRILVNKVIYRFDKPRRWDPFVFINPKVSASDTPPYKTTYIKRLVGMPGEKFEIIRGDIVVNGQIQRKPVEAQSSLWMPVYDIGYPWKEGTAWKTAGTGWKLDGKRMTADCPGDAVAWAEYAGGRTDGAGNIRDVYGYDQEGSGGRRSGFNVVTDVRVSFDVKGARTGKLVLSLLCDEHEDRAEIDFSTGTATLLRDGKELKSPVRLSNAGLGGIGSGGSRAIAFWRLDYLLALVIDGKQVVECDFWSAEEYARIQGELARSGRLAGHDRSGVRLGGAGTKLELANVRIDRDVYYTDARHGGDGPHYMGPWDIPRDGYFAMGDNSPDSLDSRYWGVVPADHLIGKALLIWYSPTRVGLIH
jgi:signal peptidase I